MVSRNLQLATVLNIRGRVDQSIEQELNKLTAANERAARQFLQNNYRQQTATSRLTQAVTGSTRSLTSYTTELRHIQQRLEALGRERQNLTNLGESTDDIDEAMRQYGERLTRIQGNLEEIGSTPFGRQQLAQFRELEMRARSTQETFNRLSTDQTEFARQWQHQAGQVKALGIQLTFAQKTLRDFRAEAGRLKSAGGNVVALQQGMEQYEEEIESVTRALASLKAQSPGAELVRPLTEADEELTSINRRLSRITDETRQAARAAERWQQRLQRVDRVAGGIRNAGFGLAGAGGGILAATLFGGERASVHREAALQAGFTLRDYFVNTQALRTLGARDQIDLQRELGKEGRARIVDPSEETVFAIQRIAREQGKGYEQVQLELLESLSGPDAVRDILLLVRRAGKDLQPFFAEALIGGEGGERLLEVVTRSIDDIEKAFANADPVLAASLDTSTETLADMRVELENLQFRGQLLQSAFATGLIPLMRDFSASVTPAVMGIQRFAEENPRAAQTIAGLTLTITGLGTAMTVIGLLAPGLIRSIHGIRAATVGLTLAMRANPLFAIAGLVAIFGAALLINRFIGAASYSPAERSYAPSTGDIITTGLEGSDGGNRRDPRGGILLEGIPFQPITPTGNPCPELAELEKQTAIQREIAANTLRTLPVTEPEGRPKPFLAIDTTTPESVGAGAGQAVRNYVTADFQDFFANPGRAFEPGTLLGNLNDLIGDTVIGNIRNFSDINANGLPGIPNLESLNPLNAKIDELISTLGDFGSGLFGSGEVTINQTFNGVEGDVANAAETGTMQAVEQVTNPNN